MTRPPDPIDPQDPRIVRPEQPRSRVGRALAWVRDLFSDMTRADAADAGRGVATAKRHPRAQHRIEGGAGPTN